MPEIIKEHFRTGILSLSELEKFLRQQEEVEGPLCGIGARKQGGNFSSFRLDEDPPSKKLIVTLVDDTTLAVKKCVASGIVYVGGDLKGVLVTREV